MSRKQRGPDRPPVVTEQQVALLQELFNQGYGPAAAAVFLGCSTDAVFNACKRHGILTPRHKNRQIMDRILAGVARAKRDRPDGPKAA